MSPWQHAELLQPITTDRPCGESLEDSALLSSFDVYRIFGQPTPRDSTLPWNEIQSQALTALGTSKDLRVLAHLATALLRTEGVAAFAASLVVASQWLNGHWADTYPLVDEDAVLRRNALNCFADQMAVIDGLRRAPLVRSRQHGTVSLRDLDGAVGADEAQINAAFADAPLEELSELQHGLAAAVSALNSIMGTMAAHGGPEAVPALEPLSTCLSKADHVLRSQLAARGAVSNGTPATQADAGAEAGAMSGPVGAIRSRQDAIRALDAVADFFRRNEPSSPIPLFVERAKRLVSKDFLEVLADIAPDALGQARSAGGLSQNE